MSKAYTLRTEHQAEVRRIAEAILIERDGADPVDAVHSAIRLVAALEHAFEHGLETTGIRIRAPKDDEEPGKKSWLTVEWQS